MASELYNTIDALSREKGLIRRLWSARWKTPLLWLRARSYKIRKISRAELDKDTGKINAFAVKTYCAARSRIEDPNLQISVEDAQGRSLAEVGGELRFSKSTEGMLGRIPRNSKQMIFQKVREAERTRSITNTSDASANLQCDRKAHGRARRIFDIGKAEARMSTRSSRGWNRLPWASACAL